MRSCLFQHGLGFLVICSCVLFQFLKTIFQYYQTISNPKIILKKCFWEEKPGF